MGDEFDESSDLSSDVDTSDADMSSDIPEDIPDDIPEDVPDDVPEDVPKDEASEDIDDAEDIPEDVPEDEVSEEVNDTDDIPEDTVNADEEGTDTEGEATDTEPDDVSDTEADAEGAGTEDNVTDTEPDDVSDTEADAEGAGTEDNVTDTESDEVNDADTDVEGTDTEDNVTDTESDAETDAEGADTEGEAADTEPDDVSDTEADAEGADAEGNVTDTESDEVNDADTDAEGIDTENNVTDTESDADTDAEGTDTEGEATDTDSDDVIDTEADAEGTDTEENVTDTEPDEVNDADTDVEGTATEDNVADTESDVETDAEDAEGEATDTESDEVADTEADVDGGDIEEDVTDAEPDEVTDTDTDAEDNATDTDSDNVADTEANVEGADTEDKVTDAESDVVDNQVSSDIQDSPSAMEQLSAYMNEHNYGPDDFEKYSQDPEWRALQREAFPDYEMPELSQENAQAQLTQYMQEHNYGIGDYAEYSQDPVWKELHQAAYPNNDVSDPNNVEQDISTDTEPYHAIPNTRRGPDQMPLSVTSDELQDIPLDSQDTMPNFSELSDKTDYTDKMRRDMEFALAGNPDRKEDWDVVRGRLSDEFSKEATSLNGLADTKQQVFDSMRQEYMDLQSQPDSPDKQAALGQLTQEGRLLSDEISAIRSKASYADNMAQDLARDLNPNARTMYSGVAGKGFTDIHSSLIQKQGNAVKDFKGTCGDCSIANTCELLGEGKTESEVIERARELNARGLKVMTDRPVPSFYPEAMKEKIRRDNGGTSPIDRKTILESFGFNCENTTSQSLNDIAQEIESGNGAIINVDYHVLNKDRIVSTLSPSGTNHALTITGVEKNSAGDPVGLWIHDTGVCSSMGNAFYCNAKDYETWKNTPNCTVQYVSKKTR